jgi:5-methylcytosine-specific restriction endonuclease McrA
MTGDFRLKVRLRAQDRCEYCFIPLWLDCVSSQIEHIVAKQHGGKERMDNLALACAQCNRHKGPNLSGVDPQTRRVVRLFNPRRDRRTDHFRWFGGRIVGKTPRGRATVQLLAMNTPSRVDFRDALMEEGLF